MTTLTIYRDETVVYNNWPEWVSKASEYCSELSENDRDAEFEKMFNCKIHSAPNLANTGNLWYKIEFFDADNKDLVWWILKWS